MIDRESEFASAIRAAILEHKPRRIVETGTFYGDGSTRIIVNALSEAGVHDYEFYTIEVDPVRAEGARKNLADTRVVVLNGLSVRHDMLLGPEAIGSECAEAEEQGMTVDYPEHERRERYHDETDFKDRPEELLAKALARFDGKPDFVLLDSAGHLGLIEFKYLLERLSGGCVIALDDIKHVKHYKSSRLIKADPRFTVLREDMDDRFGFLIARFEPNSGGRAA